MFGEVSSAPLTLPQLLSKIRWVEVPKDGSLYDKGSPTTEFYFVLNGKPLRTSDRVAGKLELLVDSAADDELKFSKAVDENEFFGLKESSKDARHDYARGVADLTKVLAIDRDEYSNIIKKTEMGTGEKKIEFLMRFIPKIRNSDQARRMLEEFEVFFIKEQYTQGYQVLKEGEQDDYLYLLYRGKCNITLQRSSLPDVCHEKLEEHHKQLVIGAHRPGDCIGEASALNDFDNPYTVEVATKKAEIYKIHRSNFIKYFGGLKGDPVCQMRGNIILMENWVASKKDQLAAMS